MRQSPADESRPTRSLLWALATVGLVAVVSLSVIYFLGLDSAGETADQAPVSTSPMPDPAATGEQFLAAWATADWATIRDLVEDPDSRADEMLAAWWSDLEVASVDFSIGSVEIEADAASVPFSQVVRIEEAGTWTLSSTLQLVRRRGDWRVAWSPAAIHPALEDGDHLELVTAWQDRALITDRDGRALVKPAPAVVVGLIPQRIVSRDEVAAALEQTLAVTRAAVDSALDASGVQPDWFLPIATVSREDNIDVRPALYPIPGVAFRLVDSRAQVGTGLAEALLGSTGEITAEQLDTLGPPYAAGLTVGRSGLESAFERQLAGTPTVQVVRRMEAGASEIVFTFPSTAPSDLRTTLSSEIQLAAESALANVELPASIVAIDAATGEIRAVASTPNDGFSRATSGLYPPGSTFKIVVAAALLESGLEPTDPVSCPTVVNIDGREFGNANDLPRTMSFEQAFAQSCNTAFIQLAADLGPAVIGETAARFGFGGAIKIGIAAADASFPGSADPVQQASAAIGQGEVLASPLNMASVAAMAATGSWRPPTLTAPVETGDVATEHLSPSVVAGLRTLMRAVVVNGTGRPAAIEGQEVSGKTGTAQITTAEGADTIAWFVGFSGDLAFAVQVEGGASGGSTAGPIAAAFLENVAASLGSNLVPGCVEAGADWVTFQGDIARAGCSQAAAIRQPKKLWQAEVGISGWLNSPIIVDDLVIVGSAGTRRSGPDNGDGVYALDLQTGRRFWRFSTSNDVNGVSVGGQVVVATGDEGSVWGIDVETGAQLWSFAAGSPVFTNPLVIDDTVFVGDASGVLWALGLDGSRRWQAQLDGAIRGGASSDGRMVFAVSEHGEVGAFTLDGFEMWRTRIDHLRPTARSDSETTATGVNVFAVPTVIGDKLIVPYLVGDGPTTPAVVALDRFVGTVMWRGSDPDQIAESFSNVRSSPARHNDTVIVASSLSTGLQGFDSVTGQALWATGAGSRCERQWASPVVVDDLVLLPRPDGALHAYRANSGELVWRIAPASPSEVATLAQCETDGQQLQDGFDLQASVAIAPDGTVIVASTSQLIYAIGES